MKKIYIGEEHIINVLTVEVFSCNEQSRKNGEASLNNAKEVT